MATPIKKTGDNAVEAAPLTLVVSDDAALTVARAEVEAELVAAADGLPATRIESLAELVRGHGVHALSTPRLREAAQSIDLSRVVHVRGAEWFIDQLASTTPPLFDEYCGMPVLSELLTPQLCRDQLGNVLEYVQEQVQSLLMPTFLERIDDVKLIEKVGRTERAVLVRTLTGLSEEVHTAQEINRARVTTPRVAQLVRRSVVPLSGDVYELVFLALVQASELLFRTTANGVIEARKAYAEGDPAAALEPLDRAVLGSSVLPTLAGLYTRALPTMHWQLIRTHIAEPSALQGSSFPTLLGALYEFDGLLGHPRVPAFRQALEPAVTDLLYEVVDNIGRWQDAHPGMVRRQNAGIVNPRVDSFLKDRADRTRRRGA